MCTWIIPASGSKRGLLDTSGRSIPIQKRSRWPSNSTTINRRWNVNNHTEFIRWRIERLGKDNKTESNEHFPVSNWGVSSFWWWSKSSGIILNSTKWAKIINLMLRSWPVVQNYKFWKFRTHSMCNWSIGWLRFDNWATNFFGDKKFNKRISWRLRGAFMHLLLATK